MDYVSSTTVSTSPPNNNHHPREICQSRRSSRGRLPYPPLSTHSPPSSSPPRLGPGKPFSLQTRRLQLRNAGFRAAQLPGRNISDHLTTTWRSLSGGSERETDKENILRSPTHDDSSRDSSLRRKVNVLQEINNSTSRRRHTSPRPSVTTLFADISPREHSPDSLFSPPPRKPGLRLDPPISFDGSDDSDFDTAMKSREYSVSGSSPLARSPGIIRRKRRNNRRQQADYETTKYIEHLEAQLAASQTELDSRQTSPIKPQITKLRSLNAEIRALKQEIADWQDKFESRVREEIGSRSETECKLKAKISALEEKIEADRRRMKELVYENEMQAQKLRNAAALTSTNRSLERRVDVLTELLAVSPTRTDAAPSPTTEVLSPIKSGAPRLRPRSMMPCIPCSPRAGNYRVLQPLILDPKTSDDVPCLSVEVAENNSMINEESTPDQATPSTRPESMLTDSLSAESSSLSFMSRSQRSSMLSQSSSTSSWSLPFPISPDFRGRTQNRHKSMRRFPSGACNLKPLILPSATATMSDCPPSATFDHILSPQQESQSSSDPTTAFLDGQGYYASWDDKSTCAGAQQDSLDALEGRTCYYGSFEEVISRRRKPMRLNLSRSPHRGLDLRSDGCLSGRSFHGIILEEEDDPELNNPPQLDHNVTAQESPQVGHDQSRQRKVLAHEIGEDYMQTPSRSSSKRHKNQRPVKDRTPKSNGNESRSLVCSPIAGAACDEAVDILTKYMSWFQELQRRPTELARKIIAHAWYSNWRRLGKLSWWVLGLFFGPQIRDEWCTHPSTAEVDNYDWHRYSMATFHSRHDSDTINHEPATDLALLSETSNRLSGQAWCDVSRIQDGRADPPDKEQSIRRSTFGRSLCLWAKFSFAIIVAIGMAVKNGPGSLLEDCPQAPSAVIAHDLDRPEEKNSLARPMGLQHSNASHVEDVLGSEMSGSSAFAEDDAPQFLVWPPNLTMNDFPHD